MRRTNHEVVARTEDSANALTFQFQEQLDEALTLTFLVIEPSLGASLAGDVLYAVG